MFESSSSGLLTQEQINWCNKHIDGKWKVNSHGEIEVNDDITVSGDFDRFPVKFAPVKKKFDCSGCKSLISLIGAPYEFIRENNLPVYEPNVKKKKFKK